MADMNMAGKFKGKPVSAPVKAGISDCDGATPTETYDALITPGATWMTVTQTPSPDLNFLTFNVVADPATLATGVYNSSFSARFTPDVECIPGQSWTVTVEFTVKKGNVKFTQ